MRLWKFFESIQRQIIMNIQRLHEPLMHHEHSMQYVECDQVHDDKTVSVLKVFLFLLSAIETLI